MTTKPKAKPRAAKIPNDPRAIKLSIAGWCAQTGMNYETTRSGLVGMGHEIIRGTEFTLREFIRATARRGEFERARKTAAEADAQERENRVALGELMNRQEAMDLVAAKWGVARAFMIGVPASYASRVNPTDPQAGRVALEDLTAAFLARCRDDAT